MNEIPMGVNFWYRHPGRVSKDLVRKLAGGIVEIMGKAKMAQKIDCTFLSRL